MKKILYVTNISRTVNTFFIPHMNMLVENGYSVECACRLKGEHPLDQNRLNNTIIFHDVPFTRNPLDLSNIRAFRQLYKLQKEKRYDSIHVHTPIAALYTRLLKIFFKDVNMIYTAHGYHFYKGSSKLSWIVFYNLEKWLSKYTDKLITINLEDYENSKKFKCKELLKINGVGVETDKYTIISYEKRLKAREGIGLSEDDFVLIMVGEHNKNKNQIQLIKAIEVLEKEYPKIKAILIGDGELINKNRDYIKNHNIKNVKILGFRKDVIELINASDVLCSFSYREGLPKNIIEGLSCAKVILGTRVRGTRDLIEEGINGYCVKLQEYDETVEAIKKLYKIEKKVFEKMQQNSRKKSIEYDMKNILKILKDIY